MKALKKSEMVSLIRNRESALWTQLKGYKERFGDDAPITQMARSEWYSVNTLLGEFGLEV
tara:strand:+ start:626 stop:805 length:180 start_codon:yes stop_codon:yes gene_type:complete